MFSTEDFLARRALEKQFIEEGTSVWRQKKSCDAQREMEDKIQLRSMLKSYNPWGKPGYGAPMPGALRKQKLILDEPDVIVDSQGTSALTLGRPGHGAPLRTGSGRTRTHIRTDPSIRFQYNESARKSVDNDLRYKTSPKDKENYRRQLDAMIVQKRQMQTIQSTPGKEKSKGWSNEVTLRRLPQQETEQVFQINGGVELVPLLAKHRASPRCPLPTTDITRIERLQNGPPKTPHTEIIYHNELSDQVNQRQQQLHEARINDMVSSQRHFETWKGLWGRPGHGAPKGVNLAKEKLEFILYELPAHRLSVSQHN